MKRGNGWRFIIKTDDPSAMAVVNGSRDSAKMATNEKEGDGCVGKVRVERAARKGS